MKLFKNSFSIFLSLFIYSFIHSKVYMKTYNSFTLNTFLIFFLSKIFFSPYFFILLIYKSFLNFIIIFQICSLVFSFNIESDDKFWINILNTVSLFSISSLGFLSIFKNISFSSQTFIVI